MVSPRGAERIAAGHPWVYRPDVVRGPARDATDGGPSLVSVRDRRGKPLGVATWAAHARLALRMVARGSEAPPASIEALVRQRLGEALGRRRALALDRDAYRVMHAEADLCPGLVVDRYGDAAVVQTTSVAMNAARAGIAAAVRELLDARIVVARDDGSARDFEELPRFAGVLEGSGDTRIVYRLGENRLEADLLRDGKTGGFLDQADNHAAVAALAPAGARALDAFTYHGGFALALARSCDSVLAARSSPRTRTATPPRARPQTRNATGSRTSRSGRRTRSICCARSRRAANASTWSSSIRPRSPSAAAPAHWRRPRGRTRSSCCAARG